MGGDQLGNTWLMHPPNDCLSLPHCAAPKLACGTGCQFPLQPLCPQHASAAFETTTLMRFGTFSLLLLGFLHADVQIGARVRLFDTELVGLPGGSVRRERANLKGLVNGCIEAKFCNKICVGKLSPRCTQCTPLHRSLSSNFC